MFDLDALAALPLFENTWVEWVLALTIAGVTFTLLVLLRSAVRGYLGRLEKAPGHKEWAIVPLQVFSRTTSLFFVIVSAFIGVQVLTVGAPTTTILVSVITIALFWQSGVWAAAAAAGWLERKRRASMLHDRAAVGSLGIIGFLANVVIWAMVGVLTLDNLGVDITALVAGLGIGGIAIALAVQNVLGDLFAALSITLDRPFVVGDALAVGEFIGTVEYVGIKSTRLRSLSGEQIIISNNDLLTSRVRNYGRMNERRVVFTTSVTYETPLELVERVPQIIREIVESQTHARFDRSHFAKHGPASLDYETVYYVLSADYRQYMDVQEAINLRLHRALTDLGIEFAYPTQKLFVVHSAPDADTADRAAAERPDRASDAAAKPA